ncbi:DUF6879 family protein [Dokdonia sp.]|uniref:DUF6879 family protein n=1 Tax=Dokdonia sp. TaxID=2024995 RepID=UPI003267CBBB
MKTNEIEKLLDQLMIDSKKAIAYYSKMSKQAKTAVDKEWGKFWLYKTEQTLLNFSERMSTLTRNKMQVSDPTIDPLPFWLSIMDTVQGSIKTTNIVNVQSYGNILNNELLLKQKEVVEKGIEIHRVFIYDQKNKRQISQLISTLSTQLLCGIKVYVLEESIFRSDRIWQSNIIEKEDFMIIDDTFIYETYYDKKNQSYRNNLIQDAKELSIKKGIWERIVENSIKVTYGNVNKFNKVI